nr:ATP-binding protein [uncultured Sphingomonas sp.]
MIAGLNNRRPIPASAIALGLLVFGATWLSIELSRVQGRVAAVSLANGITLAVLLSSKPQYWRTYLLWAAVGNFAANVASGDDTPLALGLSLINQVEVWLAAALTMPVFAARRRFDNRDVIARFVLGAGVAAPLVSAILASTVISAASNVPSSPTLIAWFAAEALGLLTITPFLLSSKTYDLRMPWRQQLFYLTCVAASAMVAIVVLREVRQPFLFSLTPLVVVAALRLPLFAAMAVVLAVSMVAAGETFQGRGIIAATNADPAIRLYVLQAFLAAMLFTVLPLRSLVGERELLGRAAAKSDRLFHRIAEASIAGILHVDRDGRPTFANGRWTELTGLHLENMRSDGWLECVEWGHRQEARTFWQLATTTTDPASMEIPFLRDGRSAGWAEVTVHPEVEDGRISGFVIRLVDQTERRRADAAMRENNRLLRMAERSARVGHWRFDLENDIFECSDSAKSILGMQNAGTARPRDALRNIHPDDQRRFLRTIASALNDVGVHDQSIRLRLSDGEVRHLCVGVQADISSGSDFKGLFGIVRDQTHLINTQCELMVARDEAEAAASAKSNFLATMSHEIRTPMTGVLGMIDLLQMDPEEADRDRYFATLRQSADLLMAVLDDVLDYSKIDNGSMRLDQREFDIEHLVQSTIDLFGNAASRKGLLVSLDSRMSGSPSVRGDPVRIQQVVSNLLNNAIKFTHRGRVVIMLRDGPGNMGQRQWWMEFRDTGIGIAPDDLSKLFQPFMQAENSNNRQYGGTGLGLAISRRLIEAMGGEMGVESRVGRGSTFWCNLIMEDGQGGDTRSAEAADAHGLAFHLDVLVAEDNPVNQLLIGAILRKLGHRPTIVENGRLAVEAVESGGYDCVLMDMQMPELDGPAATRAIRNSGTRQADIPIFALTADASPERRRFYEGAGLTGFLTKPVNQAELASALLEHASWAAHKSRGANSLTFQAPIV